MSLLKEWLPIVSNVAIAATFVIYMLQWKTMVRQLRASQDASRGQNLLALIEFLQRPDLVSARGHLVSLENTNWECWNPSDRKEVERALAGYDIAAILLKEEGVQRSLNVVLENWGHSIRKCFQIASPYIEDVRLKRSAKYWDDFQWLVVEANKFLIACPNK